MTEPSTKVCERCNLEKAIKGQRYCNKCRKHVLKELSESGALEPFPFWNRNRSAEQMENTYETKNGTGH